MESLVNALECEEAYIRGLNACFDGWGDAQKYRWHFLRRVGSFSTDFITLFEDDELVAGSAVVYRRVSFGNGETLHAGIMAASWTLPRARGKGCFSRMIELSRELAGQRGAAMLLAFVTSKNASYRRLAAVGSLLAPTHYLIRCEETSLVESDHRVSVVTDVGGASRSLYERFGALQAHRASFAYSYEEWCSQFLARPFETAVVAIDGYGWGIVEVKGDFERVTALIPRDGVRVDEGIQPLLARAQRRGTKFFTFATSMEIADRGRDLKLDHLPGYVTLLALTSAYAETCARAANGSNVVNGIPAPGGATVLWGLCYGDKM